MVGIDWVVIIIYCAGLLAIGGIFSRLTQTSSGMFVAGRSSPWWLSGISAYMTMFSAGTFVVWGGITYEFGMVGMVICSMYGVAAFIAGKFFAARWRRTSLSTAGEFVQLRLGKGPFHFYTWYRFLHLFTGGLMLYALAVMLCPLMPLPDGNFLQDPVTGNLSVDWACVILACIVIVYTMAGGLWAVLMTDMLQFFVLTLCVIIVVPLILIEVGGIGQVIENTPEGFFKPVAPGFSFAFLIGWMLVNCFQLGAEWHFVQRHLCVATERDAQKAMYLFGVLYLVTPVMWMAPPLIYRALVPDADPEKAYIMACSAVLPAGMIGMMIAAMFSATASSMSSLLNVFASILTDDVYCRLFRPQASEKETVRVGRVFTILIGLYMLAGAIILPRLADYRDVVIVIGSLVGSSLLLPTIWSLFSKRVGTSVVWWTIVFGVATGVVQKFGFSESGFLTKIPALSGLVAFAQEYHRATDIIIGMTVPLIILCIAELRGRTPHLLYLRLEEAIVKARAADHPHPSFSKLPALVMAWCLGLLGVVMLVLTPLSEDRWPSMLAMTVLLMGLSAFFALYLSRKAAKLQRLAEAEAAGLAPEEENGSAG